MKALQEFIEILINRGLEAIGLYYSTYSAYVYSTEDPENMNRLQLIIPMIDRYTPLRTWALPKDLYGGPNYGVNILPEKGDLVWVEFEFGRLQNPLWSHGYFGKGEKPKAFTSHKIKGFVSPGGIELLIDDEKNEVRVKLKDGVSFILSKDKYYIAKDENKLQPLVLGDELKTQLELEKTRVTTLIEAIKNSPITPGDGGLAFKSSIVSLMSPIKEPDYSKINSEVGKTQ